MYWFLKTNWKRKMVINQVLEGDGSAQRAKGRKSQMQNVKMKEYKKLGDSHTVSCEKELT